MKSKKNSEEFTFKEGYLKTSEKVMPRRICFETIEEIEVETPEVVDHFYKDCKSYFYY